MTHVQQWGLMSSWSNNENKWSMKIAHFLTTGLSDMFERDNPISALITLNTITAGATLTVLKEVVMLSG